jgi:hypothetical protein
MDRLEGGYGDKALGEAVAEHAVTGDDGVVSIA